MDQARRQLLLTLRQILPEYLLKGDQMTNRAKAEIARIRATNYPWTGNRQAAADRWIKLSQALKFSDAEIQESRALQDYLFPDLAETQSTEEYAAQQTDEYPENYSAAFDPDLTYDESTNPSNGWRDPETHELLPQSGSDSGANRRTQWVVGHQVDRELQRRGERYANQETRAELADQYLTSLQAPKLELDLADLEPQPSGSGTSLPYPALRISTVSGAVYLNNALVLELRRRRDDHRLPSHALISLTKDFTTLVVQFLDSYAPGSHVLGLAADGNRGYSISCGATIQKLTWYYYQLWPEAKPSANNAYHRKNMPDSYNAAQDFVYGRRRAHMVNSRLDLWATILTDPRV